MSELALGWCTYNGDHMSNYAVNAGVPKSLVKHLVSWYAGTTDNKKAATALLDVLDTPISPELLPADAEGNIAQKTEDVVGPYALHDFFLFHMLRNGFTPTKILKLATMAFDGSYEPRGDIEVARSILPPFLCPAIQAFLPARRSQGRLGLSLAPGRLAHAQRCFGGGMSG